jgi:hypothetical protein
VWTITWALQVNCPFSRAKESHPATDPVGVKESSPGQRPGEPKIAQPKALKGRKSSGALLGRDPVGTDKFPGRCPGLYSCSLSG